jgi:prepilin-type N-terminal cleavage/methylation domain-containing protein
MHASDSKITLTAKRREVRVGHGGFTLVELLVVMLIMGLLSALAFSTLKGGINATSTAWNISGTVEQARAYAMAQNTYVWVGFDSPDVSSAAQTSTAVFSVASLDGSSNTAASNLIQIDRPQIFSNLSLSNSVAAYTTVRPASQVVQLAATPPTSTTVTLPGVLAGRFPAVNDTFLEVHPDGSVSLPIGNWSSSTQWIEIGLMPTTGTIQNTKDTAVLQIGCLTGQLRVFRP